MTNTKKVIVIESWETWNLCPPLKKEPEIPFKIIQADECPDYFTQALTSAKQRLLIIAPWLKNSVINDDLESKLTQLLSKNVKVLIGYGFEETDEDSHSAAIERITQLAQQNLTIYTSNLSDYYPRRSLPTTTNFISTAVLTGSPLPGLLASITEAKSVRCILAQM